MMSNYKAPPGRPQAVPPGLFDDPEPIQREGEHHVGFGNRYRAWQRRHNPVLREQYSRRLGEGVTSGSLRTHKLMADACDKDNQTETRGRWVTQPMYMRMAGVTQSTASTFCRKHAIEKRNIGRVERYLLPFDLLPDITPPAKPSEQSPAPSPKPVELPLGEETRIRRIKISKERLEQYLTKALDLVRPSFVWYANEIIVSVEEDV